MIEQWNPRTKRYARVEDDGAIYMGRINQYGQLGSVANVERVDADTYQDCGPWEPLP